MVVKPQHATPIINGYKMQSKNIPISGLKIVNIISGILYNQFLFDRDSCSDIRSRLFL